MKAKMTRDELTGALGRILHTIPSRANLPVLSGVLVEADNTGVRFTGTDLDTWIRAKVPAEVEGKGAAVLDAKHLMAFVKYLPELPVLVAAGKKDWTITCGNAEARFRSIEADEFPNMPDVSDLPWRLDAELLREAAHRVAFCASTDESRPILHGVLWQARNGNTQVVCTNGHRLARALLSKNGTPEDIKLIVPARPLTVAAKIMGEGEFSAGTLENHIAFSGPATDFCARLIEGPYPDYDKIIPKPNMWAKMDRTGFTEAIHRAGTFADDQNRRLALTFDEGSIRIQSEAADFGSADEKIEAEYSGRPMRIGANAHYLLEILSRIDTNHVRIGVDAPERAMLILPDGGDEYLALLMPLRLLD